jgi:hypothetical protein
MFVLRRSAQLKLYLNFWRPLAELDELKAYGMHEHVSLRLLAGRERAFRHWQRPQDQAARTVRIQTRESAVLYACFTAAQHRELD